MSFLSPSDRLFVQAVVDLINCNPFLPERIDLERVALGDEFDDTGTVWSKQDDLERTRPNLIRLNERSQQLASQLRERLASGEPANRQELGLYEELVNYVLFHRIERPLADLYNTSHAGAAKSRPVRCWKQFLSDYQHFLDVPGLQPVDDRDAAHLFAMFFQVRRAFAQIFHHIVGRSMPAARLRAAVWQSVFTHDMRRYRRSLHNRMGDFTTLITGPSGTGKELVARAIGLSRYIPFQVDKQQFGDDIAGSFHALNPSALSPTLIESELFGHCRGAFTGAVADRAGWLELCEPLGTVFLDEIGDLDAAIQVKLLRVLQTRSFQRLGETTDRRFHGKIIAATNQNLASQIRAGSFREDFYYRLCSDIITTPTLREQLADNPDDLGNLVVFIARRIAGDEAENLAGEVETWIVQNLGRDYPWPGNIRELEQCVRNLIIRQQYRPRSAETSDSNDDPRRELVAAVVAGSLTAEELLCRYCTLVYAQTGSYEQAAQQLKLDRRTVKSKVDAALLARLQ